MVLLPEADASEDGSFDVEAAITNFVADLDRLSLELPHMTTGQRRHARKVVEHNPDLKCESYGFGSERQLHIFKKGFTDCPSKLPRGAPAVNVKNTFIDDWVAPEGQLQAEVRNTFIHIEEDSMATDERIIQTMPRDMFRQNVKREASVTTIVEPRMGLAIAVGSSTMGMGGLSSTPPATPSKPAPAEQAEQAQSPAPTATSLLAPGTQIMVEGLVKAPAFNGLTGAVQFYEQDTGRYNVLLSSPAVAGGVQRAKLKGENLRLVAPPPYSAMGTEDLPRLVPTTVATPLRLTALV